MSCSICGHIEETDTHAILECPLASQIWHSCCFDCNLWASPFRTLVDYLGNARKSLDEDLFGDFLTVMRECWNARNDFIFKNSDHKLSSLGKRVIDFVHSYRHTLDSESSPQPMAHKSTWSPLTPGYLKLNFDGASMNNSFWGWGWGFVLHSHSNDVLLLELSMVSTPQLPSLKKLGPVFMP